MNDFEGQEEEAYSEEPNVAEVPDLSLKGAHPFVRLVVKEQETSLFVEVLVFLVHDRFVVVHPIEYAPVVSLFGLRDRQD